MEALTLIFLSASLVFRHFQSSDGCDWVCPEFWRLNQSTNDGVIEVSFSNKTVPWNYTFLLWQWNTNRGNSWDASLLTSYQKDELLGNAVLRNSAKVVLASLAWKLHNATLEWSYNGGESNESDWTIHLCRIGDWSFIQRINGKWSFQLGDMELYRPHGSEPVILDTLSEKEVELRNLPKPEMPGIADNQISEAAINKYRRLRRSRFDKENFVHSNATPAEKWEIVQSILDRVFGNSEDLRRNGWVSHLNIFNILGRIFGLDQIFGSRSPLAPTTTESTDTTEPDAETVNTNFLRRFPGSRLKSKET